MLIGDYFREKQIVERIKANDRTVLGEIYLRYQKMIFHYVRQNGGSELDADDILQETIIVLWQKVNSEQFQLSSKLSTYLMAIAKNKWLSEMRKHRKIVTEDIPMHFGNHNPTSLDTLISNEKIELVRKTLEMIPEICKKILLLYYFEEKSMEEIARILRFANTDVAKSKKYQCKKSLEEILRQELPKFGGE
jgi:RNA polymerase sigma factor (sigma-70 family)